MALKNANADEVKNRKPLKSAKSHFKPKDAAEEMNQYFTNKIAEFKRSKRKRSELNVCSDLSKGTNEKNEEEAMEQTTEIPVKRPKKTKKNIDATFDKKHELDAGNGDDVKSKKPSKRQMKKLKAEQRESKKKEASKFQAMQKALTYISKWKHARNEWKFVKVIQMWLVENILDETLIPNTIFPTVLEYFEGCKGSARQRLLEKGMSVMRKVEDSEEEGEKGTESTAYKRARELLQILPTDT